jgi:murein DD-endopeptidase MepM/ murein hydrolase activator NlpD
MSNSPSEGASASSKTVANFLNSLGLQQYAGHAILLVVIGGLLWFAHANLFGLLPTSVDLGSLGSLNNPSSASPTPEGPVSQQVALAISDATPTPEADTSDLTRQTDIHTNIPNRPRGTIDTYTVLSGDTLFGIAEKFNLKPETLVWGNPILKDDPHLLRPGQELRIPPTDGVLRDVQATDKLDVLARYYGVAVDDIVDWPGNDLDPDNPQLVVGSALMVPGGKREFVQFVVPVIARKSTNVLPTDAGPGQCAGGYTGGAVGSGSFIWPANNHFLSGNNYWSGHLGIDIAAGLGAPLYAADSGVVVYAGWNNWGYGNMVVIDHGNGWQTLYGHMSQWNVSCGQSVLQGNIIGLAGSTGNSTGPHLHFEMNYNGSRPNPFNYLP